MSVTFRPAPPAPNPNVPAVSQPLADLVALVASVTQLRLGVYSLGGLSGAPSDRAVTFNDLSSAGLTTVVSRVSALEGQMMALDQRVTAIEEFIASLPPPPLERGA
jgi:hypothetical protein